MPSRATRFFTLIPTSLKAREARATFFFHCHILGHEDGGMMKSVRVVP